jgi:hypothetical protein
MSPPEKGNPLATSPDDPNGESESTIRPRWPSIRAP